jgi:hypothetical protein
VDEVELIFADNKNRLIHTDADGSNPFTLAEYVFGDGQRRVAGRRDFGDEADTEKRRTVTKQSGAVPAPAPNSAL